ncbi:hypothetical protein GCM10028808_73630 [Spirosoma migulaei]
MSMNDIFKRNQFERNFLLLKSACFIATAFLFNTILNLEHRGINKIDLLDDHIVNTKNSKYLINKDTITVNKKTINNSATKSSKSNKLSF